MAQSWTIGIICYNEKGTIAEVTESVIALLEPLQADKQIILVDDASTDGSREIITSLAGKYSHSIKAVYHAKNMGIGESIRDVYFNAKMENVVFVPGDGQFDVKELQPYLSFPENQYICFYRQENQTYSAFRNVLSYLNKQFNKLFLGLSLRDVNWVKAYKTEVIQNLDLRTRSSVIESEICAKLNYLKFVPLEVQSKYLPRSYGESKGASWSNMVRVSKELLTLSRILIGFRINKRKARIIL